MILRSRLTPEEASIYQLVLEQQGIRAEIVDSNLTGWNWWEANAFGGTKLIINDDDYNEANELLSQKQEVTESESIESQVDKELTLNPMRTFAYFFIVFLLVFHLVGFLYTLILGPIKLTGP